MPRKQKKSQDKLPRESVPNEKDTGREKSMPVPKEDMTEAEALETDGIVDAKKEKIGEDKVLEKWRNLDVASLVERGWQYRVKTAGDGKQYMALRKGGTDRGLGGYTPSKEKLLFHYYPEVKEDFMRRHPSGDRRTSSKRAKPFLSVPIRRVAVVPTNYRPSLDVIRYFHTFKKNGFPGDFSDFINGNVEDHFVKCNGIILPVLLEELEEDRSIKNVQ